MYETEERNDQGGFTIVELVVAAAILFFVLTAMFGLVAATQRLSVDARQRSVLTNAMSWYVERIKNKSWDQIGIQGRDASGTILPSERLAFDGGNGTTIYVDFTVAMGAPTADSFFYKEARITATTLINGRTFSTRATIGMKNPNTARTTASISDPYAPSIVFTPDSVQPGEELYLAERYSPSGQSIFKTTAASPSDKIVSVQYKIGDIILRAPGGAYAGYASWTVSPPASSVTNQLQWDTTQPGIEDGFQTVLAIATDDQGRTGRAVSTVIVDNHPPSNPGAPNGYSDSASTGRLYWDAVPDGVNGAFAYRYGYELYREPASLVGAPVNYWSRVATGSVTPQGATIAAVVGNQASVATTISIEPFSRYWGRIQAGSLMHWNDTWGNMVTPFITRPDLKTSGTYVSAATCTKTGNGSNAKANYATTLYIQEPTFPTSALSYRVYYMDSTAANAPGGTSWTLLPTAATVTRTIVGTVSRLSFTLQTSWSSANKPYYFLVEATVTPSGSGGGTSQVLYTNAVGPVPMTSGTSSNLLDKGWVWHP